MKDPMDFSLVLYADRATFEAKLAGGFTEATVGRGEWVGDRKVIFVWLLFCADGRVFG